MGIQMVGGDEEGEGSVGGGLDGSELNNTVTKLVQRIKN